MEQQILHGIGQREKYTLDVKEMIDGVEIWMFGPRGGVLGYIILDKQEFKSAITDMFIDLTELTKEDR